MKIDPTRDEMQPETERSDPKADPPTETDEETESQRPGWLPSSSVLFGVGAAVVIAAVLIGLVVFGPSASDAPRVSQAPTESEADPQGSQDADGGIPEPNINFGALDPVPAPPFTLTDFDGNKITNETFRGKPLVLNVWASWCVPCREEMPAFNQVFNDFDGAVEFLGVAFDDGEADARGFAEEVGVDYTLALDANGFVDQIGILGMPSTYFINENGEIVEALYGPRNAPQLSDTLKGLFPQLD